MTTQTTRPDTGAPAALRHRIGPELVGQPVIEQEVFERADVASVHLVLSDATRRIVGEPELRALGPDSYLVNTARADLVDQVALRRALTGGWIAGAGLDVYDIEAYLRGEPIRALP